ncbi:MAG: hypothetical protein HC804_12015, partial [Anaerolineae bacterium]|nr:hypothetical protein [Anaerolineae bacterium]
SLPALTLFQHTNTYALSRHVAGAEVGYLYSPRDRYTTFANWSLLYQEIAANCPETPSP